MKSEGRYGKKVSIIIVNYNGEKFIEKLIQSLSQQTYNNFEVIFVDNASRDRSVRILMNLVREKFKNIDIKLICNSVNLGFCGGNATGLKYCTGKYVVLLNNDTFVDAKWLDEMVKVLDNDDTIAICQSRLIDARTGQLQAIGGFQGVYGKGSCHPNIRVNKVGSSILVESFFYGIGASIMIRKEALIKCGGFDDKLFLGDVDLSWKIRLLGYRIVTNPASICYHYGSYATKKYIRSVQLLYHVFREKLRILLKMYSLSYLVKRIPIWAIISLMHAIYLTIRDKKPYLFSWFKAVMWNVKYCKDTLLLRRVIQRNRKVNDVQIEQYMLPYPSEIYELRKKMLNRTP
jgi:GT2 family glycosyltransferase